MASAALWRARIECPCICELLIEVQGDESIIQFNNIDETERFSRKD